MGGARAASIAVQGTLTAKRVGRIRRGRVRCGGRTAGPRYAAADPLAEDADLDPGALDRVVDREVGEGDRDAEGVAEPAAGDPAQHVARTRIGCGRSAVGAASRTARCPGPPRARSSRTRQTSRCVGPASCCARSASRPRKPPACPSPRRSRARPRTACRRVDVRAPDAVALLQAQRVDGAVAAGDEAVLAPRVPQRRQSVAPYSVGQYISQPSSPTNVTRSMRTGRRRPSSPAHVMNGNASLPRSCGVSAATRSRAPDPTTRSRPTGR